MLGSLTLCIFRSAVSYEHNIFDSFFFLNSSFLDSDTKELVLTLEDVHWSKAHIETSFSSYPVAVYRRPGRSGPIPAERKIFFLGSNAIGQNTIQ